ncbi:zinc finger protein, putative [Plasmodium sp. gorilla clade G2]|uniref:zinc finger protein, putative n=1 Tax=Plasmodium sp. gorilla clade G2 TaxID=880535 RepID=UPI000D2106FA|nr:zinc finger protein, putative [Plasmodium sp. gorilla clade G2]SOV10920.1 zinc finger protein, putative [Plasmodium sp. gorilla clade G2]
MSTFINNAGNYRNKTLNSTNKTLNINYKVQSISPNSSLFCPACNIPFTYKIRINPCYHIVCKKCYKLSLEDQKCLMCNNDINDIENIFIKDKIYICPHNDCKKGFINEKSYQYHIYFKHKFLKEKNEINRKSSNNSSINGDINDHINDDINDTINFTTPDQKNNYLLNFNNNMNKGGGNIGLSTYASQWPNELVKNSMDGNININMINMNNVNNMINANTNDKDNISNNNMNPFDIKTKKLQEGNESLFTNIPTTNTFINTNKLSTSNILTNNNNITSNNNYKFLKNTPGTDTWTNSVFSFKSNINKDINTNKSEQKFTDVQHNKNNEKDDELDNLEDFM